MIRTPRLAAALVFFVAVLCGGLAAAYDFPPLSGRVVDAAGIIPAATKASVEAKLADLEQKSGIQFVVATVNSLDGDEIEPYANALFRSWKLGQKDKNNGALLLIAPKQRKVRIEVGYGLEGTLTDALSSVIIANAIAPRFKAGDFGGGVERGVDDVITVLTTDSQEWQKLPDLRLDRGASAADSLAPWIALGLFALIVFLILRTPRAGRATIASDDPRWGNSRPPQSQGNRVFWSNLLWFLAGLASGSRGGGRGGGFDDWGGGGFGGGGGSSGGGGASGSW